MKTLKIKLSKSVLKKKLRMKLFSLGDADLNGLVKEAKVLSPSKNNFWYLITVNATQIVAL